LLKVIPLARCDEERHFRFLASVVCWDIIGMCVCD
jgi:hypothetical protein